MKDIDFLPSAKVLRDRLHIARQHVRRLVVMLRAAKRLERLQFAGSLREGNHAPR